MSAATLKAAALALLASGGAWIQGANARTATGKPCSPLSPLAVKWDIMGALIKAHEDGNEPNYSSINSVYKTLRSKMSNTLKTRDLEHYNDNATWTQLSDLFT